MKKNKGKKRKQNTIIKKAALLTKMVKKGYKPKEEAINETLSKDTKQKEPESNERNKENFKKELRKDLNCNNENNKKLEAYNARKDVEETEEKRRLQLLKGMNTLKEKKDKER